MSNKATEYPYSLMTAMGILKSVYCVVKLPLKLPKGPAHGQAQGIGRLQWLLT